MKLGRWLVAHAKSADSRTSYRIDGIRLETCHQRIARPRIPWLSTPAGTSFSETEKAPWIIETCGLSRQSSRDPKSAGRGGNGSR